MGSGLTYELDDNNLTASRWILESLALQCFGAFYDTSYGRTEEQLAKMISKGDSLEYHKEELKKTKLRQEEISKWTKEQWQKEYDEFAIHISNDNIKSVKNAYELSTKHGAVYADLKKLYDNTKDRFVKDVAMVGMKQLDMCESETVPYIVSIPTLEKYIEEQKQIITRDLKYHSTEAKNKLKILKKNIKAYDILRKETHKWLT